MTSQEVRRGEREEEEERRGEKKSQILYDSEVMEKGFTTSISHRIFQLYKRSHYVTLLIAMEMGEEEGGGRRGEGRRREFIVAWP